MPIGDKYINSVFSCMLNTEKLLALKCYSQNFRNIRQGQRDIFAKATKRTHKTKYYL